MDALRQFSNSSSSGSVSLCTLNDSSLAPALSRSSSRSSSWQVAVRPRVTNWESLAANNNRAVVGVRCASKRANKSASTSTKGRPSPSGGGFSAKTVPKPSFDAGVLLRRSEQLYTRLIAEYATEGEVREFIICVREKRSATSKSVLDDWLPVAELALVSEQDASSALPILLGSLCREVAECAGRGAVTLRSISRSSLEYAYEPAEAFYEHVSSGSNVKLSSEECPYQVLGLQKGDPASEVRAAYRSLAAKNHPDKQFGGDSSAVEAEFKRVTNAYDQIKRAGLASEGVPSYASLGGNARNGLSEPIVINSSKMSSGFPEGVVVKGAVRQLDPEISSRFLARLFARSSGAATAV